MVKRGYWAALSASAVMLAAPGAWAADGFGSPLSVAISGERMFGVFSGSDTEKIEGQTAERTSKATGVSLLSNPYGAVGANYSFMRVGFDVFAIQGLSLGAALGYFTLSTSSEVEDMGVKVSDDGPTFSGFVFAPRVGYAYMFMDLVGVWPRAGVTYVTIDGSSEGETISTETSSNRLAFTLEVPVVISPAPHTAILLGPTLDLGIGGGSESSVTNMGTTTTTKADHKATEFGLQAGLALAF